VRTARTRPLRASFFRPFDKNGQRPGSRCPLAPRPSPSPLARRMGAPARSGGAHHPGGSPGSHVPLPSARGPAPGGESPSPHAPLPRRQSLTRPRRPVFKGPAWGAAISLARRRSAGMLGGASPGGGRHLPHAPLPRRHEHVAPAGAPLRQPSLEGPACSWCQSPIPFPPRGVLTRRGSPSSSRSSPPPAVPHPPPISRPRKAGMGGGTSPTLRGSLSHQGPALSRLAARPGPGPGG